MDLFSIQPEAFDGVQACLVSATKWYTLALVHKHVHVAWPDMLFAPTDSPLCTQIQGLSSSAALLIPSNDYHWFQLYIYIDI